MRARLVSVDRGPARVARCGALVGRFQGSDDVWMPDPQFPLWTLHAWVWKKNPGGVFHMTNARVP